MIEGKISLVVNGTAQESVPGAKVRLGGPNGPDVPGPSEHGRPSTTDPSVHEWMGYALSLEQMIVDLRAEAKPSTGDEDSNA